MNAATAIDQPDGPFSMKGPLTASAGLHAAVIAVCIMGLPHILKPLPDPADPVTVELVKIDEITQTNKQPAKSETQKIEPKTEKPPEKEIPKPTPPQVTSVEPPKPAAPEKPDDVALPNPEKVKPVEKAMPKPPVPQKRPVQAKAKPEETKTEDFNALLRNLAPEQKAAAADPSQAKTTAAEASPLAKFSQQLTMSETDALSHQLAQCWKLMAGARYAENLVVDVKLSVAPDRTVRDAKVADQMRYMTDGYFRAAADSALRAVRSPGCNPLALPPQKYDLWKDITVTFDPRNML